MLISECQVEVPIASKAPSMLQHLSSELPPLLADDFYPVRFVVNSLKDDKWVCDVDGLSGAELECTADQASIFEFRKREIVSSEAFNVALLVPTGVGAEIGGHAGDATPVARLLGQVCDRVLLHPNVVNASDINEMPENALYIEGSVLTRLLMGTVSLQPVRQNRVLVVIDDHSESTFVSAAANSVNAARATYGLDCSSIVALKPPVRLRARFSCSGRAAGRVENLSGLTRLLKERGGEYDAVAISSVIDVPHDYHLGYFEAGGEMINPWGGVEAMLTHALSSMFNLPTAHSPMFESEDIATLDPGVVDPRMAAEAISYSFLQCILKGLNASPRIVTQPDLMGRPDLVSVEDISCLVQPDGCVGLPTLAALEQGITVIAVRENRNIAGNDLSRLPWGSRQLHVVENYWEVVGVIAALRAGISPDSVRRPLPVVDVETVEYHDEERAATKVARSKAV
jgi:hypothetical protein